MRTRILVASGTVALALMVGVWAPALVAQAPSGTKSFDQTAIDPDAAIKAASKAAQAAAALKDWKPARTPWGDPDLRGYWLLATYTPLERPAALADKAFYTEEEAVAAFRRAVETDAEVDPRTVHYDWKEYGMDAWQAGAKPNLRTSLIVDPPDGRIPALTPEAQQRRAAAAAAAKVRSPLAGDPNIRQHVHALHPGPRGRASRPRRQSRSGISRSGGRRDRRVSAHSVPGIRRDRDAIEQRCSHRSRGRAAAPAAEHARLVGRLSRSLGGRYARRRHHQLQGQDSWSEFPGIHRRPASGGALHADRSEYASLRSSRSAIPTTWTKPWSVEAPLPRIDPPLYEFACHEQNYGVMNVVMGTQVREGSRRTGAAAARPAAGGEDR